MKIKDQKIDSFILTQDKTINDSLNQTLNNTLISGSQAKSFKHRHNKDNNEYSSSLRQCVTSHIRNLTFKSLNELRDRIESNVNKTLYDILQAMSFVGFVSRELALIQHETSLYLTNTRLLSEEVFYQIALFNFGNLI